MLFAQRPPKNSDMPIEPNDLAENLHIRLVERLHRVVLRLKTNTVLLAEKTFHRCRFAVHKCHHDITVVRSRLLFYKDENPDRKYRR